MQYVFLVVAAAWMLQFALAYWQLRRFHAQLAAFRKLGRCAVGMVGSRWQGRTYGVLVLDGREQVSHAAVFHGWTVFSRLQPVAGVAGLPLDTVLTTETPLAGLRMSQWRALQHAAQFFVAKPVSPSQPAPLPLSH